jgi:hypothetical protein
MVLAQNHQSNPDEKSVPLTAPVWEHLASWAASISGEIPSDQCSLGTTLERLSQQPNIRLSLTNEDRQLVLKGRQNHAVTVFARGLLPLMGTSPANISCRRTSRQLHLDFVCEHSQPPTPEDAQALALGIVLLAGADIHVDRAVASLGVRWTLTISALPMKPNVEPV